MIIDDEPPQETKNTNPPPSFPPLNLQPHSFSSLPDEIVDNILARVSKWHYPKLSLVSKRFCSLLSSPELYTTRSRIGTTETCIYIFLENSVAQPPRLFNLCLKPADETLTGNNDIPYDDNSLVRFPVPSEPFINFTSTIAVGSEIYLIGGYFYARPSSAVRILDCRSHKWRDGPSMLVARMFPFVVFVDEKIYVMSGCGKDDTWMEALDIKTNTWSPLMSDTSTVFESWWFRRMIVLEGNIYAIGHMNYYAYDPKEGTWEVVETHHKFGSIYYWCVIEDVTYCYTSMGYFIWYDSKSKKWIKVNGLGKELLSGAYVLEILNHGGKILVTVGDYNDITSPFKSKRKIWCKKISLEKRHGNEIWGKIEQPSTVITFSESYRRSKCVVISI